MKRYILNILFGLYGLFFCSATVWADGGGDYIKVKKVYEVHQYDMLKVNDPSILEVVPQNGGHQSAVMRYAKVRLVYGREKKTDIEGRDWMYTLKVNMLNPGGQILASPELNLETGGTANYESVQKILLPNNVSTVSFAIANVFAQRGILSGENDALFQSTNGILLIKEIVPEDIRIEFSIETVKNYFLDPALAPVLNVDAASISSHHRCDLYWDFVYGAEEYEVEWAFVDELTVAKPTGAAIFDRSITITTSNTWYSVNTIFPLGDLYFRVRPIGRYIYGTASLDKVKTGAWSAVQTVEITTANDFEADRNWEYSQTFAEDGKQKGVVSYYDQSLRSRQIQTNLSTEKTTLVAENKYDFEGRASVSILPVPAIDPNGSFNNTLFYKGATAANPFAGYNKYDASQSYEKQYFDKTGHAAALGYELDQGAGGYFSINNNLTGPIHNDLLPDAAGFPITQTTFTRDGTGRVTAQSGVGPTFKIGSGHETKYLYGSANETELRRLFGSNVGASAFYKKNTVIDANGQVSVTYINQMGRVIATALSEEQPENVEPIYEGPSDITVSLNDKNNLSLENRESSLEYSIPFAKEKDVINPDIFTFNFDLTGVNQHWTGPGGAECLSCIYELSIQVYDPEGMLMTPISATPVNPVDGVVLSGQDCSSGTFALNQIFTLGFGFYKQGEYRVVKKLKLLTDPIDISFLEQIGVISSIEVIQNNYNSANPIDELSCIFNCEQCEVYPVGSQLRTDCEAICATAQGMADQLYEETRCSGLYAQMLADVSPGGWMYQSDDFLTTAIPSGIPYTSAADIRDNWKEEWVPLYVLNHREYCHYDYCSNVAGPSLGSDIYDRQLSRASDNWDPNITWAQVQQKQEYLNIINWQLADPFFEHNYINSQITLFNEMSAYVNSDFNGDGVGAYGMIAFVEQQLRDVAGYSGLEMWNALVGIYLGAKERVKESYLEDILACPFWEDANANVKKSTSISYDDQTSYNEGIAQTTDHCNDLCDGNVAIWMALLADQCDVILEAGNEDTYQQIEILLKGYCLSGCVNMVNPNGIITMDLATYAPEIWQVLLEAELLIDNLFLDPACGTAAVGLLDATNQVTEDFETGITYNYTVTTTIPGIDNVDYNCEPCEILARFIDFGEWQEVSPGKYEWREGEWNLSGLQAMLQASADYDGNTITPFHVINAISSCLGTYPFHELAPSCSSWYDNVHSYLSNFLGCPGIWDIEGFGLPGDPNADPPSICSTDGQGVLMALEEIRNCAFAKISCFEVPCGSSGVDLLCTQTTTDCKGWIPLETFNEMYGVNFSQVELDQIIQYYSSSNYWPVIPTEEDLLVQIQGLPFFCSLPTSIVTSVNYNFDFNIPGYGDQERLDCIEMLTDEQEFNFNEWYEEQLDEALTQLNEQRLDDCFSTLKGFNEDFWYTYSDLEYHYTLYYYDQAGNLVQTVPPAGVGEGALFNNRGKWTPDTEPDHQMVTRYQYNSLGQVVTQSTPETRHGDSNSGSRFFYDKLGRIRFSQDARQAPGNDYSYTKYDELGRIKEVGQVNGLPGSTDMAKKANDPVFPEETLVLSDVIKTFYNEKLNGIPLQENLRNRVAQTENESIISRYSYDIHGNVKELYHELKDGSIPGVMQNYKLSYEYDLISGNVNQVAFNKGQVDQFYHKYEYDADNRLTHVYTSKDGEIWRNDARYFYYLHGPLARIELGEDKSQGLDYYYTLQGWIKGVNSVDDQAISNSEGGVPDLGGDGMDGANRNFAKDEAAYKLGYFRGDYRSIGNNHLSGAESITWMELGNVASTAFGSNKLGLYNGNIAWMQTDIQQFSPNLNPSSPQEAKEGLQARIFRYDQLHRIRESFSMNVLGTSSLTNSNNNNTIVGYSWDANNLHGSSYTYDPNGNLQTLTRRFNGLIDDLTYHYGYDANTNSGDPDRNNLLEGVSDVIPTVTPDQPGISTQPAGNYNYDRIGNLIKDQEGKVSNIQWNLQGKVAKVTFEPGEAMQEVRYTYDVTGNRLSKTVIDQNGIAEPTYYIRDASGNVMSIYRSDNNSGIPNNISQKEVPLYGSSRIGIEKLFDRNIAAGPPLGMIQAVWTSERGQKSYELSNHLGNVLAVVSDKKLGYSTGQTADNYVDEYRSSVVSANDYYPFGMQMPGRSFDSPDYRYGFNGKEKDEGGEWGSITTYDYGFRIYNPGIGRFLSVDPLTKSYPMLTPYQFASNRPIDGIDLDGLEYLDSDEANFNISLGQTWIKPKRFYQLFPASRPGTQHASGTIRQDAYGNDYTGPTFPIQQAIFPSEIPLRSSTFASGLLARNFDEAGGNLRGQYENTPKRKDGKPDKRYASTKAYEQSGRGTGGLGKAGLALMVIDLGLQLAEGIQGYNRSKEDSRQLDLVAKSFNDINEAFKEGLIPDEYLNVEAVSKIADFVFQGTKIEDETLQQVAENISKKVSRNYRYPITTEQIDSGMDNYPSKTEYIQGEVNTDENDNH